jgi:hypothetical protein
MPALADLPLRDVGPLDLQSLYSFLLQERDPTIAAGTVLNLHLVLTQAFGQAVKWDLLDRSPAAGAQPPRPRRPEPVAVDANLAARMLDAAQGHPIEAPLAIALATGMRRSSFSHSKVVFRDVNLRGDGISDRASAHAPPENRLVTAGGRRSGALCRAWVHAKNTARNGQRARNPDDRFQDRRLRPLGHPPGRSVPGRCGPRSTDRSRTRPRAN